MQRCELALRLCPCAMCTDYVTRYAKKDDAMPKRGMGDADSDGSDDGSDADEKGFLSSSEDEEDPAAGHLDRYEPGYGCLNVRATLYC